MNSEEHFKVYLETAITTTVTGLRQEMHSPVRPPRQLQATHDHGRNWAQNYMYLVHKILTYCSVEPAWSKGAQVCVTSDRIQHFTAEGKDNLSSLMSQINYQA